MHASRKGFTLIELLVVVAIIALLVSILLPSLGRAKDLAQSIVCAHRDKDCYLGWTFYGNDFSGVWMATWDRNAPWASGTDWPSQYPYTMVHYVTGGGIPLGQAVYEPGHPDGPWYSEDGRHGWPPTFRGPDEAVQLQCPVVSAMGQAVNPIWYNYTSISYFIMAGRQVGDTWIYNSNGYPKLDLMTHPTSTGLLMCLSGILTEGGPNAWCVYDGYPLDPHMEKSNYIFCDGHLELLSLSGTNEAMWQSMWERGTQP